MPHVIRAWQYYRQSLSWWDTLLALTSIALVRATSGGCRLVRYVVVAQPVPDHSLNSGRLGSRIGIHRLRQGDKSLESFPRPTALFKTRFEQGAICYGAFRGEHPVGFIWFTTGTYEEDEVRCRFHPVPDGQCAWDFDVYVAPEYRFSGAFQVLWNAAFTCMREQGIKWTVSRISAFNPASLSAHRRMGSRWIGALNFVCLGPLQFMVGTLRPHACISWKHHGRPMVVVDPLTSVPWRK